VSDPYNLNRFVEAQASDFEPACAELRAGRKRSHWIWYIFPQIAGLGYSSTSRHYAISSKQEAEAYLAHPILGPRLRECTRLVNEVEGRSAYEIFGTPDDMKFRSSITLFAQATTDNAVFTDALQKYFAGLPDTLTLDGLNDPRRLR